jgi:hypothetical protein
MRRGIVFGDGLDEKGGLAGSKCAVCREGLRDLGSTGGGLGRQQSAELDKHESFCLQDRNARYVLPLSRLTSPWAANTGLRSA